MPLFDPSRGLYRINEINRQNTDQNRIECIPHSVHPEEQALTEGLCRWQNQISKLI